MVRSLNTGVSHYGSGYLYKKAVPHAPAPPSTPLSHSVSPPEARGGPSSLGLDTAEVHLPFHVEPTFEPEPARTWASGGITTDFRANSSSSDTSDGKANRVKQHKSSEIQGSPSSQAQEQFTEANLQFRQSQNQYIRREKKRDAELYKQQDVGNNPQQLVRHSSLCSLDFRCEDIVNYSTVVSNIGNNQNCWTQGNPRLFSRISLGSGVETPYSAKELLKQCNDQGIKPKSKSDLDSRRQLYNCSSIPSRFVWKVAKNMSEMSVHQPQYSQQRSSKNIFSATTTTAADLNTEPPVSDIESSKLYAESEQKEKNECKSTETSEVESELHDGQRLKKYTSSGPEIKPTASVTADSSGKCYIPHTSRHTIKDRFRTFVWSDSKPSSEITTTSSTSSAKPKSLPSSPQASFRPKLRCQEDSERFSNRKIKPDSKSFFKAAETDSRQVGKDKMNVYKSTQDCSYHDPYSFQANIISEVKETQGKAHKPSTLMTGTQNSLSASAPKLQASRTGRQKRQEDPKRYQTRTIAATTTNTISVATWEANSKYNENQDTVLNESQDRFKDSDLTAEELEILQQDASIIICSLNETYESMGKESPDFLNDVKIFNIETLCSISSDEEADMNANLQDSDGNKSDKVANTDEAKDENKKEKDNEVTRRARILKPSQEIFQTNQGKEAVIKAIRGQRKPLYYSGKRCNATSTTATECDAETPTKPNAERSIPIRPHSACAGYSYSPKLPRATRTSTMRQNSNLQRETISREDSVTRVEGNVESCPREGRCHLRGTTPQTTRSRSLARNRNDPSKALHRQNTFTKVKSDAPLNQEPNLQVETKESISDTQGSSKPRLRHDWVPPPSATTPLLPGLCATLKSKPQYLNLSPNTGRSLLPKSASLPRNTDGHYHVPKSLSVTKGVTSRIASLWKKVDRVQSKSNKGTRVWMCKPKSNGKECIFPSIVRSTTFEKLTVSAHRGKNE